MKKILLVVVGLIIAGSAFAAPNTVKSMYPLTNQTVVSVGGAKDDASIRILRTDEDGRLIIKDYNHPSANPLLNGIVDIDLSEGGEGGEPPPILRTQMPDLDAISCVLQAPSSNAGAIYIGGSTVTNADGANEGIVLYPGWALATGDITNLDELYAATDTDGDDVKYLCK